MHSTAPDLDLWGYCFFSGDWRPPPDLFLTMSVYCIVPSREAIIDVVVTACPCRGIRSTGRILKAREREDYVQGLAGWNISSPRQALW